jgi:hypothetical protein
MINAVLNLVSYGSFGTGALGELFAQWEAAGIFEYALPFLLIFALVFGLLSKLNIFSTKDNPNKGVNIIISLAVAFMSLQFNLVSVFFAEIFPRFGIALSIILVILILGGLFMPTNKESNWFLVALAIIVFIIIGVVVYNSLSVFGWGISGTGLSFFWGKYGSILIFAIVVIVAIIAMTPRKKPGPQYSSMLSKLLGGE